MKFDMWWIWMGLASIFIMGEVLFRGSFFIWIGFGAAASGILSLLEIQTAGQIAVFINISGILILLERRFSERYTFKKSHVKRRYRGESLPFDHGKYPLIDDEDELNVFRRVGAGWEIRYRGVSYTVKHTIGLLHIRNLIIKKGEWVHCTDLKRLTAEITPDSRYEHYTAMSKKQLEKEDLRIGDDVIAEEVIERLSLEKIKKLRDILIERKELNNFESPEERIDQLKKLDFIEKYLKSVTDNKGRPRKIYDQTETDRKAVSAAINRCRNSLHEHNELFNHFKSFIHAEGNAFRYLPDRPIAWKTD